MKTRGQKRRRGERDSLWDLIVNNDDVSFQHILAEVECDGCEILVRSECETRKMIKRSSRKGELKRKFRIEEMSSISTLELAWEHCPWGALISYNQRMNETYFCWQVAYTNKLELLKWIREEKKCEWRCKDD